MYVKGEGEGNREWGMGIQGDAGSKSEKMQPLG